MKKWFLISCVAAALGPQALKKAHNIRQNNLWIRPSCFFEPEGFKKKKNG